MVRLLGDLLGFDGLTYRRASVEIGGEAFAISHRNGDDLNSTPVHIVAIDQRLDRRNGHGRRSPYSLMQEYLNRSDALWGIVTNGTHLRLLRHTVRLAKPTYLEFDLQGMIESNLYSEFVLLYRLVHATRFPPDPANPHDCLLEQYYLDGVEQDGRVREHMREGVEEGLKVLGTAFLAHPESTNLKSKVAEGRLDPEAYYRQLLRLVYRLRGCDDRRLASAHELGQLATRRRKAPPHSLVIC